MKLLKRIYEEITLIHLMIIVALIAILMAIAIPVLCGGDKVDEGKLTNAVRGEDGWTLTIDNEAVYYSKGSRETYILGGTYSVYKLCGIGYVLKPSVYQPKETEEKAGW